MYTEYLSWNHYWRSKTSSLTSKTQRESYFFNNHESDDDEYYYYLMRKKIEENDVVNHEQRPKKHIEIIKSIDDKVLKNGVINGLVNNQVL